MKSTASGSATEHKYIVDITGKLPVILMDLNLTDSSLKKKYIYADRQILAQHDIDTTQTSPDDDKLYFYLHDRLGSVRLVLAANGDVVKYYTYEPFGEVIEDDGTFDNAFRFTGQYFDAEIEEYYLRARQYNPGIAGFTTRDPIRGKYKEPLTLHKYLYCGNDPVNRIDPSGQFFGLLDLLGGQGTSNYMKAQSALIAGAVKAKAVALYTSTFVRAVQFNIVLANLFGQRVSSTGKAVRLPGRSLYYTQVHGVDSALAHDGGRGVAEWAILQAIAGPVQTVLQAGGKIKIIGQNAVVVLNQAGEVVTCWATHTIAYLGTTPPGG